MSRDWRDMLGTIPNVIAKIQAVPRREATTPGTFHCRHQPSLLEAMASGALIIAHNNPFNKGILENNAVYFSTAAEISEILKTMVPDSDASKVMLQNNINKIKDHYNWHGISLQYENLFKEFLLQEVNSGVRKNALNKSLNTASR